MTDAPWLEAAKLLPCGRSMKIHCCSTTPSMMVNHMPTGYSAHCFKCKAHPYESKQERSIKQILQERRELLMMEEKTVTLPKDFQPIRSDTPTQALWFLKYGITIAEAQKRNFGYSAYFDRLVIPIYDMAGNLTDVQMRAYKEGHKPKWLSANVKNKNGMMFTGGPDRGQPIVIVEDVLSAIKIGRTTLAVAILGSDIGDYRAQYIAANHDSVILWFDGDKAGRLGALDCEKQFYLQGITRIKRVVTDKDPKEYTNEEIQNYLPLCLT